MLIRTDVDECQMDGACDRNAHCVNSPGSFACECRLGYELLAVVCVGKCGPRQSKYHIYIQLRSFLDTDECGNDDLNDCHHLAECSNTEGSYTCECMKGYEGDGRACEGLTRLCFLLYSCERLF